MTRPLVCGFLKARNEILRGNLHRCIENLSKYVDTIVACDDGSTDGTREYLQSVIPKDQLLLIDPGDQDFRKELAVKNQMLDMVRRINPVFVFWADTDETVDESQIHLIRPFLLAQKDKHEVHAWRSHYLQLWRNKEYCRTDDGFGDGRFVKVWRWQPGLSFRIIDGTHHQQFPQQIDLTKVEDTPWKVIHWGNYGVSLRWKAIQYYGGLGGVERHMNFEDATYESTDKLLGKPVSAPLAPKPVPYTPREKRVILDMKNLKNLPSWFTVVIPTFNRAAFLPETLNSLLRQTYQNWVAVVLDDGSTDNTYDLMQKAMERDPRIFYCRYDKLGAVAMNERGGDMASEFTEYWTRLGSDDTFEPHKLRMDAAAMSLGHDLVYGSYRVHRDGALAEICNLPEDKTALRDRFAAGGFAVSWANIACTSKLLRKVKKHYGSYCDARLRNMEDFLVNYRLTRFAKPVWRGIYKDTVIIDPGVPMIEQMSADRDNIKHDAMWRVNPVGASSDTQTTANEDVLTRELIAEDIKKWI